MSDVANKFAVPGSKFQVSSYRENNKLGTLNLELETRLLTQAARELLLAQSSDWAFQIYQGTTVEYSSRRFRSHIHRFDLLYQMLSKSDAFTRDEAITPEGVTLTDQQLDLFTEIESRDTIFPELDFRVYAKQASSNT
jgi:1,4-alpha-glucan branching enzyme